LNQANLKYKQASSIDATRIEAESIVVEDIDLGVKNYIPVKKKQERSMTKFPDLFTI
jgi:hypothetical protein